MMKREQDNEWAWRRQYDLLVEYRQHHSDRWPQEREEYPEDNRLGLWCYAQRRSKASGKLNTQRFDALNAIGYYWGSDHEWLKRYLMLIAYRGKHPSHWPTCREEWPAGNAIGVWCNGQRIAYKRRVLGTDKIDLLNLIEFKWRYRP